jgi:hypothetical protein
MQIGLCCTSQSLFAADNTAIQILNKAWHFLFDFMVRPGPTAREVLPLLPLHAPMLSYVGTSAQ